jgi:HEAT repeat protein
VGALSDALQDDDQWVRYYAARALAEHRHGPAVPRLTELAQSDPSVPVRIAALDALGARRTREATAALMSAAHDPEPEVAAAALRALGRIGGHEVLDTLRNMVRAGDVTRRRAAVEGFGAHATTEAVEQLEWIAASDAEPAVAELAVQQLAAIASSGDGGAQPAIDALLALCTVAERRDAAAARLSGLPVAAAVDVARGLAHADPAVRKRTVEALSGFRNAAATRHLEAAFADADAAVRETAVVAIMRLGSTAYDDTLRRLAGHDPSKQVRRAAAAALASRRSAY